MAAFLGAFQAKTGAGEPGLTPNPSVELLGRSQGFNTGQDWVRSVGSVSVQGAHRPTDTSPGSLGLPLGAEGSPGGEREQLQHQELAVLGAGKGLFPAGIPRPRCCSQQEGPRSCTPSSPPAPPGSAGSHPRLLWLKGYCQSPPVRWLFIPNIYSNPSLALWILPPSPPLSLLGHLHFSRTFSRFQGGRRCW